MQGGPAGRQSLQIQEKAQDYSGFGLKFQTPARKSAQLSRAPARAAAPAKRGHGMAAGTNGPQVPDTGRPSRPTLAAGIA
jgi:hypothetical protein